MRSLGERLQVHLDFDALRVVTHHFWVSPLVGWQMPVDLRSDLGKSDLLISKGDANYRRWLGDRYWPYTTNLGDILIYSPAPRMTLRVLKANLVAGLDPADDRGR